MTGIMSREPAAILTAIIFFLTQIAEELIPDVRVPDDVLYGVGLVVLGLLIRWKVVSPSTHAAAATEAHYAGRRAEKDARGEPLDSI